MLAKRIIPCLDIRNGQTVKGINFLDIREVGDPVEMGAEYARAGADELVRAGLRRFRRVLRTDGNRHAFGAEHVPVPAHAEGRGHGAGPAAVRAEPRARLHGYE